MMIDELTLATGADIVFKKGRLVIHQPTIKEIGLIGENNFFLGIQLLRLSKQNLFGAKDNVDLSNYSDFQVLMSIIKSNLKESQEQIEAFYLVLSLLFPQNEIKIEDSKISIGETGFLNDYNFEDFKQYIKEMFSSFNGEQELRPAEGKLMDKLMKKLNERHKKLAELKDESEQEGSLLGRLVSIIAVGGNKSKVDISQYTFYQIQEEFKRMNLKIYYDFYNSAKMVGCKDLKEPEDWMQYIHP